MDSSEICRAALAKWGPVKQTIMAFEEMSELQKELCKNQRGAKNKGAIAEEIADCTTARELLSASGNRNLNG